MASRLITPVLEEILKSYPLYSQDGKGKDAVCVAIFFIGHVRWFVLEGQPEGNDTTLFTIVCGLHETEYGYTSVNEMESVKVDGSKYGVDEIFQVEQLDGFKPVKLKSIPDEDLQAFLHNMGHYKIFCVNVKYGIQYGFRIFYLIALQNEENYEREESCSA